jgi:hypothetical protein
MHELVLKPESMAKHEAAAKPESASATPKSKVPPGTHPSAQPSAHAEVPPETRPSAQPSAQAKVPPETQSASQTQSPPEPQSAPPPEFQRAFTRENAYVTPATKRAVFQRDHDGCQWQTDGKKCGSRFQLELDHIQPIWAGGTSEIENLRILCRAHNQLKYKKEAGLKH